MQFFRVVLIILVVGLLAGCVNNTGVKNNAGTKSSRPTSLEAQTNPTPKDRLLNNGGELTLTVFPGSPLAGGLQDIETTVTIYLEPAKTVGNLAEASSPAIENPGGDGSCEFRFVKKWKMLGADATGVTIELYFENVAEPSPDATAIGEGCATVLVTAFSGNKFSGSSH
jgi:hypothetical protein